MKKRSKRQNKKCEVILDWLGDEDVGQTPKQVIVKAYQRLGWQYRRPVGHYGMAVCLNKILEAANLTMSGAPRKKTGKAFYRTKEWKELRYKALILNDGRCECCGRGPADGSTLNVDHIKPISKYPELKLELSNLQILCAACNEGKGNRDETDWREPDLRVLMGEKMTLH